MSYDPGLHEHRVLPQHDHATSTATGASSATAATRSSSSPNSAPTSRRPTCCSSASSPRGPSSRSGSQRDHPPHHGPREREEVHGRLPLRRAPHGHVAEHVWPRSPRSTRTPRTSTTRTTAHAADPPPDRQGAHARRLRLPAQPGAALHLCRTTSSSYTGNFLNMLLRWPRRSTGRIRCWSARSTCCSSCTPITSRTAAPAPCAASAAPTWIPTRRRRRGGGALRAAPRRRQRGGAAHAAADRVQGHASPSSSSR